LPGDRIGANDGDTEPNELEFDPCVVKIGKLAEMYRVLEIMVTTPIGTFTGLMESLFCIIYFSSV